MRLYYGTYGHHLSGKLYVYWGDDNLRTGQQVVAPVTSPRTGKNYNTMFTIARAQSEKNAQGEVNRLGENGIFIKTISGRDVLSLPGGAPFKSKIEWKRDSDRRYRQKFGLPEPPKETRATSSGVGAGRSSTRAGKPSKAKKQAKTADFKRSAKAVERLIKKVADNTKIKTTATQKLMSRKTAADSFKARENLKKIKQRDAFIED